MGFACLTNQKHNFNGTTENQCKPEPTAKKESYCRQCCDNGSDCGKALMEQNNGLGPADRAGWSLMSQIEKTSGPSSRIWPKRPDVFPAVQLKSAGRNMAKKYLHENKREIFILPKNFSSNGPTKRAPTPPKVVQAPIPPKKVARVPTPVKMVRPRHAP